MSYPVAMTGYLYVNLAKPAIIAVVCGSIGNSVIVRALLYDGADGLSDVIASIESLAAGLFGDQVHRGVFGIAACRVLHCPADEAVGRDRMIVGKHASTGRGSRIDTGASSLNLL